MSPFSRGLGSACLATLLLVNGLAAADEITLKNGGTIRGKIVSEDDAFVVVKTAAGRVKLPMSRVAEILRLEPKKKPSKKSKGTGRDDSSPGIEREGTEKAKANVPPAVGLLRAGKFKELERELESRRSGRLAGRFSSELVAYGDKLAENLGLLNEWVRARPKAAQALFWRARAYNDRGWAARGGGAASGVSPEAWSKFQRDLGLAQADLRLAIKLDPRLVHLPAQQLEVTRCLQTTDAELTRLLAQAKRIDPDYYWAYEYRLVSLMPKWGGSIERCVSFARESVKSRPKNVPLRFLLLVAHEECGRNTGSARTYHSDPVVRAELDEAYRQLREFFPSEDRVHIMWARVLKSRGWFYARWLLAAVGGDPSAICRYAIIPRHGLYGQKVDLAEAARWYQRAAAQGFAEARVGLAEIYQSGAPGVPKQPKRAFELFKAAAAQGDKRAICHLGICYEEGQGVAKDLARAKVEYARVGVTDSASAKARIKRLNGGRTSPRGHTGKQKAKSDARAKERARRLEERRAQTERRLKELEAKRAEKAKRMSAE